MIYSLTQQKPTQYGSITYSVELSPYLETKKPKALALSLCTPAPPKQSNLIINSSLSSLDKSQLTHQANITANDFSRDYRRISQPLFVELWLKACEYGLGLGIADG